VIAVNALVHIVPAILMGAYDPGLLTAVVLFVPLALVAGATIPGRYADHRLASVAAPIGAGILMHVVLAGSAVLFLRGAIAEWALLAAQPVAIVLGYLLVRFAERRMATR